MMEVTGSPELQTSALSRRCCCYLTFPINQQTHPAGGIFGSTDKGTGGCYLKVGAVRRVGGLPLRARWQYEQFRGVTPCSPSSWAGKDKRAALRCGGPAGAAASRARRGFRPDRRPRATADVPRAGSACASPAALRRQPGAARPPGRAPRGPRAPAPRRRRGARSGGGHSPSSSNSNFSSMPASAGPGAAASAA